MSLLDIQTPDSDKLKQKAKQGPAATSFEYDAMYPDWLMIQTVLDGTRAMRQAGEQFLPKHNAEGPESYAARLNTANLLNILSITLDAWVSKPFSEKLKISDDVPEQITELFDNIDLRGNTLGIVLRDWLREGLAKTYSHMMVDCPRATPRADGEPRTLADDAKDNLRPYLTHIKPENMIFAFATIQNGEEVLTHVRILETVQVMDPDLWIPTITSQIRVLTPGRVDLYQLQFDKKTNKYSWIFTEGWDTDFDGIPIVTFYADRQAFMMGKPPLIDLCWLNIRHWQSTSDQIAAVTVSRFPMIGVSGAISDDAIRIGPNRWLHTPDPGSKIYYVENTGKAIAAGRTDLMDLEELGAEYGAIFLKKRPGGASATARALDTAEVTSPLQDVAIRFNSAIKQVMGLIAKWLKLDPTAIGTVEVNTNFDFADDDLPALQALQGARQLKDINRQVYLENLNRMKVLGEDFNFEENEKGLEKEKAVALQDAMDNAKVQAAANPPPVASASPVGTTRPNEPADAGNKPGGTKG